jgi:hypothetical protein
VVAGDDDGTGVRGPHRRGAPDHAGGDDRVDAEPVLEAGVGTGVQ